MMRLVFLLFFYVLNVAGVHADSASMPMVHEQSEAGSEQMHATDTQDSVEAMDHGEMNHDDMDHSNMDHGDMDHGDMDHEDGIQNEAAEEIKKFS